MVLITEAIYKAFFTVNISPSTAIKIKYRFIEIFWG